uniref:Reverse transcriptase Ty1/copia-type domain-containing protein n=1 Tax=Tanacetum cinerariifolium TaxID=118510 RepID=A0A6L2KRY5_TANCI|nr:hypothetical protein [Tanacetum cinerariifolium]
MNYEPIVAGTQSIGFAGTKASNNAGQARKETKLVNDYILLPLLTADPPFSQDPKSSHNDGSKPSSDDGKKVDEDQEKEDDGNNTNNVNTTDNVNTISSTVNAAGLNEVNAVGGKISIELPFDPKMPALEDDNIFDFSSDDEDDGAVDDMNNLDTTIQIEKEVYVCQPLRFKDLDFLDKVYKVEKALYGLHQALRAWYETLSTYLLDNGFQRGKIDNTLFIKRHKDEFYGRTYILLRITNVQTTSTPMETKSLYSRMKMVKNVCIARYQVNLKVSHLYAMKRVFRKSTIRGCQYLRCRLISWQCKKQIVVANFTTEAEYVAALSCCGQVL